MKEIRHICHLSDIHIRLFKRHEEFSKVFSKLYKQILDKINVTNTIIILTGDIFHAKTDMSPEMIRLANEFLMKLADIAPTYVIAGNHDLNLSNMNRLDSLTPIIETINRPERLIYWKDSGIYTVGNVDFYVYSILDSRDKWPTIRPSKNTKIGLYHGPVYGAKTETFTVTSRHVEMSRFDGLDLVLLGDIHKHQTLQQYSIEEIEVDKSDIKKYLDDGWEIVSS
jgi:DNA repair exonuclease SbcCD nuclease subunit